MPTNTKCVHWNRSENLCGKPILLTITQYDERTLEIIVKYLSGNNLHKKCVLLFLTVILNTITFMFNIISTIYCVAVFIIVTVFIYHIVFAVQQERLLVVRSLGYQIEVHYRFGKTIRYITWQTIKSIFINEVISRHRVIFILTILTKDSSKEASAIIPLFLKTMPRLQCLEAIYQYVENCHN